MRFALHFIISILIAQVGYSQIQLMGEIRHQGKALDQVMIKIYDHDELLRTVAASKRGHFEMDFPLNEEYVLVFHRPFMIPVRIAIDTRVNKSWNANDKVLEIPLNMEMNYRYQGMDIKAYADPVGAVRQSGKVENSFEFFVNEKNKNEIKAVNDESLARELKGEKAIDFEEKVGISPASEPIKTAEETANPSDAKVIAETLRAEREVNNYNKVEQAVNTDAATKKEAMASQDKMVAARESLETNYITQSKRVRTEATQSLMEEQQNAVDAKVKSHQISDAQLIAAAKAEEPVKLEKQKSIVPVDQSISTGWFYEEELLVVEKYGLRQRYKKVIYNWLLFDATYYYRNDQEIDAKEYEAISKLFN